MLGRCGSTEIDPQEGLTETTTDVTGDYYYVGEYAPRIRTEEKLFGDDKFVKSTPAPHKRFVTVKQKRAYPKGMHR